jgi:DNA-binding IclR family transcriptional regulator
MPKRLAGKRIGRSLPALTPRAREIMMLVINSVALGTHDNDAEVGAIAERLGSTPARVLSMVRQLQEQGYATLKSDFIYPTVAALRWQNPDLSEREAAALLRRLR